MDFDNPIHNPFPINNTTLRINGIQTETTYTTSAEELIKVPQTRLKYSKYTIQEKIFLDFFRTFVRNDGSENKLKMKENEIYLKSLEVSKIQQISQNYINMPDFYNKNITNNTNLKKTNLNPQDIKSDFPILNNSLAKEINHLNPPDRYKNFYLSKENNYWTTKLEKNLNDNLPNNKINTFINPKNVYVKAKEISTSNLFEVVTPKINSKFGHFDEYKNSSYEKTEDLKSVSAFYNVNKKNFIFLKFFDFFNPIKLYFLGL